MRSTAAIIICLAAVLCLAGPTDASFTGTEVFLPSVGSGTGHQGSHWYTTVWIRNMGSSQANVTLSFLARGTSNPGPPSNSFTVPTGETIRIADLLGDAFGMGSGFGALRITSSQHLLVGSRIFSRPAGGDDEASTGQFFGAVPAGFAIGSGQTTSILGGWQNTPVDTGPFRYNFGFVETTGANATVEVRAYEGFDPTSSVGTKTYSLGGYGVVQDNIDKLIPSPNNDNMLLEVEVVSGGGEVIAFGSQITNGSNDPSTFEMQFASSLLGSGSGGSGLTSVAHDGTLAGDGTSGSPLGVADDGVTRHKLSAAGSSAGQVLTSNGSDVVWQTPSGGGGSGFSLPYNSTITDGGTAFGITNQGGGRAAYGESHGHDGVAGHTTASNRSGVYGSASTEWAHGVTGRNEDNNARGYLGGTDADYNGGVNVPVGAYGRADGQQGQVGVIGVSNHGTGVAGMELDTGCSGELGKEGVGAMGWVPAGVGVQDAYAVWGIADDPAAFAGAFSGDVAITGELNVQGSKNFRIDHPLDPANRYLVHAAVESDEVLNQYTGNVTLDASGHAVVRLPDWFGAVNTDVRYQLTAIGAACPDLHVAREIKGNTFEIAGSAPGLKVSWLVVARRDDPYARAHPFAAERDKAPGHRGHFLAPELYGLPSERSIDWAAHPEAMRRLRDAGERLSSRD